MSGQAEHSIERRLELRASVPRVWRALTDHQQFGEWFGVALEGPFIVGKVARGRITHPGYEHLPWEVLVIEMEPERLFSFTWHPYAVDQDVDYSIETPTLVEFKLKEIAGGTVLLLRESGFDKIPSHRQPEAFRMNQTGWDEQIKNIQWYVTQSR